MTLGDTLEDTKQMTLPPNAVFAALDCPMFSAKLVSVRRYFGIAGIKLGGGRKNELAAFSNL